MPGRLLLRRRNLHSFALSLRVQVPGGVVRSHRQPAALLHPAQSVHRPDALPHRVQVQSAGPLQRNPVPQRDVRDVRGQEDVRPVPCRAVLPNTDPLGPVPRRIVLRGRSVGADAVPGELLLPAGVVEVHCLPCWENLARWVKVQVPVHDLS